MKHAVIVHFFDFDKRFWSGCDEPLEPLHDLERELGAAVTKAGTGELDGHEIAMDGRDGTIYLYGPDARALYDSVSALLRASPVTRGGFARLRYGPARADDIREEQIEIR